MHTLPLSNPNQPLDPEELESWEPEDFDDVLPSFEISELENELVWNNNLGWQTSRLD